MRLTCLLIALSLAVWALLSEQALADATPGCGAKNEVPCEYAETRRVGRAKNLGCKGADIYWSPLKGGCWECPSGYERNGLMPLTGDKACRKGTKRARAHEVNSWWGCQDGEFHRLIPGYGHACYTCGTAYKRTLAGLESPRACKVRDEYVCDGNQTPRTHYRNGELVTRCGNPFDARAKAKQARKDNAHLINAATSLAWELGGTTDTGRQFRDAVDRKDWNRANRIVTGTRAYQEKIEPLGLTATVGVYGDASVGAGANAEAGIALGLPAFMPYTTVAVQGMNRVDPGFRISVSADAGVAVGLWFIKPSEMIGPSFGLAYGVSALVAPSVTVWWSDDGKDDFIGLQVALGVGAGIEWAEMNWAVTQGY